MKFTKGEKITPIQYNFRGIKLATLRLYPCIILTIKRMSMYYLNHYALYISNIY